MANVALIDEGTANAAGQRRPYSCRAVASTCDIDIRHAGRTHKLGNTHPVADVLPRAFRFQLHRKAGPALNDAFTVRKKWKMHRCFSNRINCAEIDRS
jgi:hypothetical protein